MTVVTDTSVVLNLCWLGLDSLLALFFDRVLAPVEVREEFERLAKSDARFGGLIFPSSIEIANASEIPDSFLREYRLDTGEIAALALALERGIRDILIDERAGRAEAVNLGLRPSGLLGLLIRAKREGHVAAVLPLLDRLQAGARFRVSEVLRAQIASNTSE
jgi:predicted nucleic acid-binding protein